MVCILAFMHRGFVECFWTSLKLGLTSFGGPVAHLGYYREVYVEREKWLSEERYAELVSLTQFLPGPGSSQLGSAISYERGGWLGALGGWIGFTLPSALLMIGFAIGMGSVEELLGLGWLHGLKLAAIAVVAVALFGMQQKLCAGWKEGALALIALIVLMWAPQACVQPVVIMLGGLVGAVLFHEGAEKSSGRASVEKVRVRGQWWHSVLPAGLVLAALMLIPALFPGNSDVAALGGLMHAGALVFGGGHVVLPLLETSTVDPGLVTKDTFLAGYGAAQAVPGPMFTFCGFLGADMKLFGNAWLGGAVAIVAVFLPGMILLAAGLPVWDRLKHFAWARAGVRGANATVVGVLAAALLAMLIGDSIIGALDVAGVIILVLAIYYKWLPVWAVVLISAVVGGVGG